MGSSTRSRPESDEDDYWPGYAPGTPRRRATAPPPTTADAIVRRRRMLALGALGVLVAAAVAAAVATSGGNGSGAPNPIDTIPPVTLPATSPAVPTTTPTTTPSATTTTTATTQTLTTGSVQQVTLPSAGKLQQGDTGSEVTALQKALASLSFDPGTPDGDFGPATKDAVVAFQNAHGLTPDGIVGSVTVKALNDALNAG